MLACAFCAVSLSAAEMKIAVIDMGRVFQEYSKTKINEAKLKKQAEIFKDYSTRLSDQLKNFRRSSKTSATPPRTWLLPPRNGRTAV